VPQQDARKNYIAAHMQPHVVGYLVGRLAAVLGRARKGAPGRTTTG
jgi:hypothetical protein